MEDEVGDDVVIAVVYATMIKTALMQRESRGGEREGVEISQNQAWKF